MIQPIPIIVEVALMVNCRAKTKTLMPAITEALIVELNRVPVVGNPMIAEMMSIIMAKIKMMMIQPEPIVVEVALMANCVAKPVMVQPIPIIVEVALMVNCRAKTITMMPAITETLVVDPDRVPVLAKAAITKMLSVRVVKIKSVMI